MSPSPASSYSAHLVCIPPVSEWCHFRKDGDEWDKNVHDGAVAFARGDGVCGGRAPEFKGSGDEGLSFGGECREEDREDGTEATAVRK